MAVYNGKDAVVTVQLASGGPIEIIGKRKEISYDGSKEFISEAYQGEDGEQNTPGTKSYEGSLTFHHDPDDAGQSIVIDSFKTDELLRFVISPTGTSPGNRRITFDAFVTDDPNKLGLEENVEKSMSLKINGIPAETVIS